MATIKINNIDCKEWNEKVYNEFVYLNSVKTPLVDAKQDIVNFLLHKGILGAFVTWKKELTVEQVAVIAKMGEKLMENSIETLLDGGFQMKLKYNIEQYCNKNF